MALPGSGGRYTYAQLEGLWVSGGGPPRLAPLMAAIAMAESGGDPQARNGSGASGLWQILGNPFPGNPFDPATNARMAVAKWRTQGLGAWVTYTTGTYKRFLRRGVPPAGAGATAGSPYRNPLRGITGLQAERVDMGVDYSGTGPIYALGPGVITQTRNAGWPGGAFIGERLTAGPLAGRYVYAAENIEPQVRVGQKVDSGTRIGTVTGGIETGFAAPPGTGNALGASQFSGSNPTAYGEAYSKILGALGAPAGVTSGKPSGDLPGWLSGILAGLGLPGALSGGAGANAAGGLGGIGGAIGSIGSTLSGLASAIDWLFHPENWVRVIAGVSGGVLTIGGVLVLSHAGESMRGPALSRPMALPVGVLMVGAGGVLLFVAFHNLGAANFGELLGDLRDRSQDAAAPAGQKAAA